MGCLHVCIGVCAKFGHAILHHRDRRSLCHPGIISTAWQGNGARLLHLLFIYLFLRTCVCLPASGCIWGEEEFEPAPVRG